MNSKIYFSLFCVLFSLIITSSAEPAAAALKYIPPRVKEVCDGLIVIINTGKISVIKSIKDLKIKSDGSCQKISDGRSVPDKNVDYSPQ